MATILLDTSVMLDHLSGRCGRTEHLDHLIEQGHVLACCPVNITGCTPECGRVRRRRPGCSWGSLDFIPVTAEAAMQAGLLRRDWRQKGHTLSYSDVTIAAVAIHRRLPLLTDNRKHFPMPELELLPLP
jgi:predicted nucleic acid-binding protein